MITLDETMRAIGAAQKKASAIRQPMNVAVADAGGNRVAHVRMDGAWIGSIDISIRKAFTARAFDIATKDLAPLAQPEGRVLRHPCFQSGTHHDLRRWHST